MLPSRRLAWISLLSVTIAWGATFTLTKLALARVGVFSFLTMRFFLAAAVLFALLAGLRQWRDLRRQCIWRVGILLGVPLFMAYALQTVALHTVSPAINAFLTGLNVAMVPLLSWFKGGQAPAKRTWGGIILAVAGLAFISGADIWALSSGDLLVVLCAFFIALQLVLFDRYGSDLPSLSLAAVEILTVASFSSVAALFHPWPDIAAWLHPTVILAVLFNGILATALAYWAQNFFQRALGGSQVAFIFSAEPIFAALIAWFVLGDIIRSAQWLGGGLIFSSMILADPAIQWPFHRKPRPVQPFSAD
ncbi:MAG: DMT family transporter [Firmicutes bacterium]|nr:DMT family transporter [Bacillota bacterium]